MIGSTVPFTLEQAVDIAEDFQDLIDTEIRLGDNILYIVDAVIPGPFDTALRDYFLNEYREGRDPMQILHENNVTAYDVLVILHEDTADVTPAEIDIRMFAAKAGINYKFPQ